MRPSEIEVSTTNLRFLFLDRLCLCNNISMFLKESRQGEDGGVFYTVNPFTVSVCFYINIYLCFFFKIYTVYSAVIL